MIAVGVHEDEHVEDDAGDGDGGHVAAVAAAADGGGLG